MPPGTKILDLACGSGRNSRLFLEQGFEVVAADRDLTGLGELASHPRLTAVEVDLEDGRAFPFDEKFGGVVVTNYLYRPIMTGIVGAVDAGGVLIYETFAKGNERFGPPHNPDFLLEPGELLEAVSGKLRVLGYEDLLVDEPRPAAVQRIAARRETG